MTSPVLPMNRPTTDEADPSTEVGRLTLRAASLNQGLRAAEAELQRAVITSANLAARWTAAKVDALADPEKTSQEVEAKALYQQATERERDLRDRLKAGHRAVDEIMRELGAAVQNQRSHEMNLVATKLQRELPQILATLADTLGRFAALHGAKGALVGRPADLVTAVGRMDPDFHRKVAQKAAQVRDEIIAIDTLSNRSKES